MDSISLEIDNRYFIIGACTFKSGERIYIKELHPSSFMKYFPTIFLEEVEHGMLYEQWSINEDSLAFVYFKTNLPTFKKVREKFLKMQPFL